MSLHTDALADLVRDSVTDSDASVEDWLAAIDQVFGADEVDRARRSAQGFENEVPWALARCLVGRDDERSEAAAGYLCRHESMPGTHAGDDLWCRINKFLDELEKLAAGDYD